MDKPILFYAVRQQPNRATGGTLFVPGIEEAQSTGEAPGIGYLKVTTAGGTDSFGVEFVSA